jgi:hypothetical protein
MKRSEKKRALMTMGAIALSRRDSVPVGRQTSQVSQPATNRQPRYLYKTKTVNIGLDA